MALWIPLFAIGTALHELLHAVAVLLLGSRPVLVLRPWPFALLPVTTTGVHIQPVPYFDPTRQFLDNLAGPGLAAALLGLVALTLPQGPLRLAAFATVLGLVFYAVIEPAYVVLDGRLDVDFLATPEVNYGVPILLALAFAGIGSIRKAAR